MSELIIEGDPGAIGHLLDTLTDHNFLGNEYEYEMREDSLREYIVELEDEIARLDEDLAVAKEDARDWRREAKYWQEKCESLRAEVDGIRVVQILEGMSKQGGA